MSEMAQFQILGSKGWKFPTRRMCQLVLKDDHFEQRSLWGHGKEKLLHVTWQVMNCKSTSLGRVNICWRLSTWQRYILKSKLIKKLNLVSCAAAPLLMSIHSQQPWATVRSVCLHGVEGNDKCLRHEVPESGSDLITPCASEEWI